VNLITVKRAIFTLFLNVFVKKITGFYIFWEGGVDVRK